MPSTLPPSTDVSFDLAAARQGVETLLRALPQKSADNSYLFTSRPNQYAELGLQYQRKAKIANAARFDVEAQFEAIRGALLRARQAVAEASGPAVETINGALCSDPMGPITLGDIEANLLRLSTAISRARAFTDLQSRDAEAAARAQDSREVDYEEEEPIPVRVSNLAASDYYGITGRPPETQRNVGGFLFFHEDVFWALGIHLKPDALARKAIELWKTKHSGYR